MSTSVIDSSTGGWDSYVSENDVESDSETKCESENCERLSDSENLNLKLESESRDCLEFDSDLQKRHIKLETQEGDDNSDNSDLESEKSQACSDLYDRLTDLHITGCGDGVNEPSIPVYEDDFKNCVTSRCGRGMQDTAPKDEFLLRSRKDDGTDGARGDQQYDAKSAPKVATRSKCAKASCAGDLCKYVTPKTVCLIILSLIYLGFTIFGIKVLNFSTNSPQRTTGE